MLSGYIVGEVCADCGELLKSDFGGRFILPKCCPKCGSIKDTRFTVGRAVYTSCSLPGCPAPIIHEFFEQGKEPENFEEIVKKYEKDEFPTLELVLFGLGLLIGVFLGGAIAITWCR